MKINSITYFFNPGWPPDEAKMHTAGSFLAEAKQAFENVGYEVQTTQLATTPFSYLLGRRIKETPYYAEAMEIMLAHIGVTSVSLGPAFPDVPGSYEVIPEALAHSRNIFFSGVMADSHNGISLEAVRACAQVIIKCATLTPNGFANLRFAALANVLAGAPFSPTAYHLGDRPAFAIATEATDLASDAFKNAKSLNNGRDILVSMLEKHAVNLVSVAKRLQFRFGAQFSGIDFSLVPFPVDDCSVGEIIERIGVPKVGLHGSLAAISIMTEAVKRANYKHTGFSGFMQSVLKDVVLARRATDGSLTIKDLLFYSIAYGTGLDSIPLPGDVTVEQISALLLDLSMLSLQLNKPSFARLMPIPGKKAGDLTNLDSEFFTSKVFNLEAEPLTNLLSGEEIITWFQE